MGEEMGRIERFMWRGHEKSDSVTEVREGAE